MDETAIQGAVLDAIACGIVVLDDAGRVVAWNRWMVRHSGIESAAARGRVFEELFPEIAGSRLASSIRMALSHRLAALISPSIHPSLLPLFRQADERAQGIRLQQMINLTPVTQAGKPGCTLQIQDVTLSLQRERRLREQAQALQQQLDEIHALQRQIDAMAERDSMTGVFNREHMQGSLDRALASARPFALVFIDIDLLKNFNHDYGSAAGDQLIKSLSELILSMLPPDAEAGRFESDEFIILMPGIPLDAAHAWAEDCRQRFAAQPLPAGMHAGKATLSAGVAGFPDHGSDLEQLLECTSLALFLAKHDGYDRVVTFNPGHADVF